MSPRTMSVILLLVGVVTAGISRRRRDNTYGDEAVTPAAGTASVAPVAEEAEATVAPEGGGAQSAVESSGYRKKRAAQNSYGDEAMAAPAGGGAPVADLSGSPVAGSGSPVADEPEAPAVTLTQPVVAEPCLQVNTKLF